MRGATVGRVAWFMKVCKPDRSIVEKRLYDAPLRNGHITIGSPTSRTEENEKRRTRLLALFALKQFPYLYHSKFNRLGYEERKGKKTCRTKRGQFT